MLLALLALAVNAQTPPPAAVVPAPDAPVGGFVPGQHRPPGDPAQIARGKTLYGIHCRACHGGDLRGGDMGGPNLLRSQVALSDQHGELILPIIQGARQNAGMPAIPISPENGLAVAAYVRSVLETIGEQGTPPSSGRPAPNVLVGNAKEGQSYFGAKCAHCHSATGDLAGIATRIPDARELQTAWVRGESRNAPPPENPNAPNPRAVTVSLRFPSGELVEGRVLHIDEFLVTVRLADGTVRSISRQGEIPKVALHDPMAAHRTLLTEYTDRDVHDVTAFLATLK